MMARSVNVRFELFLGLSVVIAGTLFRVEHFRPL
jgi:hypothetical protein